MSQTVLGPFFSVLRLYPDSPEQRFTVSPVSGCVGITDISVRLGTDATDPETEPGQNHTPDPEPEQRRNAAPDPERETGSERNPDPEPETEPGTEPDSELDSVSGMQRCWEFEELPFEVLQHIASLLDPYR